MIASTSNSRIKRIIQLQEKGRVRSREDVFIIEGIRLFQEAPAAAIQEVYLTEDFLERFGTRDIKEKLKGLSYETVSREVFCRISDTQTPQGILCVLGQSHAVFSELLEKKKPHPFFLLLEDIQDPGNLGTIFRTGEGAGVDGIIMSKGCVDIYNPKTIRSTMGSVFRVPFVYAEDLGEIADQLKRLGIGVFAAHLGEAKEYTAYSYLEGVAFLIGNEGNGLREETIRKADQRVKIPMEGQVESLNAAVSAAVLLYEVHRQRHLSGRSF